MTPTQHTVPAHGPANWPNRTIWTGDNLDIMRGMNGESVDLIYLDPPFNSNKNYAAPIGSKAAGAAFKDTWTPDDVDLAWHGEIAEQEPALYAIIDAAGLSHSKSMKSYLIMMAVRLLEMKRLLKPTGSVYLHCDPTASHYLKMLMDAVFGRKRFRNEIVWHYQKWTNTISAFQKNHDVLLLYTHSPASTFHKLHGPPTVRQQQVRKAGYNTGSSQGRRIVRIYDRENPRVKHKLASGAWADRDIYDVTAPAGSPVSDVWDISALNGQAKERIGFPTQKPLALLRRIISASSNKGDMVLDPFCGCATAPVAANELGRQWAGIDISSMPVQLVKSRLRKETGMFYDVHVRTDIPRRTDLGKIPPYKTHKHTLFGRQEGKCRGCKMAFPFRNFTIDHIVPQSKGGTDHLDNLQLLCGACNSAKGPGTQAELKAKLRAQGVIG